MKLDAWTISLQAVNFLVLAWLLHRFLYAPIQEVLARRKQELEEAKLRGEAAEAKAEEVRRALEAERSELAREREREMERVHAELERERSQRLEAAAATPPMKRSTPVDRATSSAGPAPSAHTASRQRATLEDRA